MDDRDYDLMSYGYGNTAFVAEGREYITTKFLDDFRDDNWYEGFSDYLDEAEQLLELAANGHPYSKYDNPSVNRAKPVISIVLGGLISLIIMLIMRSRMKNVAVATNANAYIEKNNGINIRNRTDRYVRTNRIRRKIERSNSRGGSSSHTSSGGFGHTSGKF